MGLDLPHLTDKETEAQRGQSPVLGVPSSQVAGPALSLGPFPGGAELLCPTVPMPSGLWVE